MPPFNKKSFAFGVRGVDLNAPADKMRPGYFPFLENWRRADAESIEPRFGLGTGSPVMAAQTPAHSVKRINDSSTGSTASALVTGAGTHLGICSGDLVTHTDKDSGYSGDPLSICIHRPTESVQPWAYVADRSRMRKINQAGTLKQIGLPAPLNYPSAALAQPQYKPISELADNTVWAVTGTAGAKANNTRVDGATRSITAILYDSGATGWCGIRPSAMDNIIEGMRLVIAGVEAVTVERVYQGSSSSTIAGMVYEGAGGPGICSVHLTTPFREIDVDQLLLLTGTVSGGSEYVRVLSVHRTPDGFTSLRFATTGNRLTGDTIQAFPSLRCYTTGARAAGNALSSIAVEFQVTAGVGAITQTAAIDASQIVAGLPTQIDDFMHCDVYVDKPELVTEIKFELDIDSTPGGFDKNLLIKILRQNDFTPVTKDLQTQIYNDQIQQQRDIITNRPGPITLTSGEYDPGGLPVDAIPPGDYGTQISAGQTQWTPTKWRINEILQPETGRVGADRSRGLNNVGALKINVIATGTVIVRLSGWWIGGGYGPDVSPIGRPRIYRYRGRDSSTGVVSNWSPAMFGGVIPHRQQVAVTVDALASTEIDKLDFEVYGGDLLGWHYVGTADNPGGGTASFNDAMSDDDLEKRSALSEGNIHYNLWPQQRPPITGSGCNIAGNLVSLLGFGTLGTVNIAPGTGFRAGGKDYTIHRILSVTKFYITESGGSAGAVSWEISNPLAINQNLPVLVGPFFGFYFGFGDKYNPWRLYYTNGNDPDTTRAGGPDAHWIDVEAEILQNMVVLEPRGRAILFTSDGAYVVEPAFTLADSGGGLFSVRRIDDAPGLYARWACCAAGGEAVWLAKDGLYATNGGSTRLVSGDLRPLFPKGNVAGKTVNGIAPPDMLTAASLTKMRLAFAHRELYFDYLDTGSVMRTMVNELGTDGDSAQTQWSSAKWLGWLPVRYGPGVNLHYGEEGEGSEAIHGTIACGSDGKLYRLGTAQGDAGAAFTATVETEHFNSDDVWQSKYFGDSRLDHDRDGATLSVIPAINHRTAALATTTISAGTGRQQQDIDLNTGQGQRAKDVSLRIASTVTTQRPKLYWWNFAYSARPDTSLLRAEDYELKEKGTIWARGVYIYGDTYGVDRAATFEYTTDAGAIATIALTGINHATMTERFYAFEAPVYLIASRVRPTDAASWEFAEHRIEGEPAPPLSDGPTAWLELDGLGARWTEGVKFDIDTVNAPVDMSVEVDEGVLQTTISAAANKGPVIANGRGVKAYSFDTPFITHRIRFNPSAKCRIFKAEVISEPEPESAYMWWAQQTDLGVKGYKYLGDGWLTVRSTDSIVLEFICDGVTITPTFFDASTNTAGARRTLHFRCPRNKFRSVQPRIYALTAGGRVAVYKKEFHVEYKPWPHEGGWLDANLLGDLHYADGARI